MRPNIELHIEELVLHGFPATQRHAIVDAVRDELTARLARDGVATTESVAVDRLDAGTVTLPHGTNAAGREIGDAIHSTVGSHANANGPR
ncbi:MAG TPA: hypothetical protein VNA69_09840 [Thermoanaerobaculia bacterium]|nr:hypothetical protein [Thermoanaerobaculia bacterium]